MSILKRNIFANFAGQGALAVIALLTVPLYVHYLGSEGFGLVSFLLSLQALTAVLDLGLSTTASREISRYRALGKDQAQRRDLVRTLETFYYASALLIFAVFALVAPWLAANWFNSVQFDAPTLATAVTIAGATVALRWPSALYQGILRGAEQHLALNVTSTATALVRGIGTVAILVFVTRSVIAFYWWQLFFALLELVAYATVIRTRSGFSGSAGRFQWPVLSELWRFSIRVGGLSLFALLLKQVDRLVISRLLPISHLGFYSAASLASNGVTKVAQPVQTAVFPRLTHLYETKDWSALSQTFHRCCQFTAFASVPFAAVLLFFPDDVLWLWTRNRELTRHAGPVLSVLAASMMLNSMMSVPFSLLLAAGLTKVPLVTNAVALLIMAPLIAVLVRSHGLVGAAYAWLAGNALYYLLVPFFIFRRVLVGHHAAWIFRDTLPFLVTGTVCLALARWVSADGGLVTKVAAIVAAFALYGAAMLAANADLRKSVAGSYAFSLSGLPGLRASPRD